MRKNKKGFTLVELVMVIILIGVLGIIGTSGLNSAISSDRGMYERQFESAIRYAQNYAMNHFTYVAVVFSSTGSKPSCSLNQNQGPPYSGYAVCACNGATPSVLEPIVNPLAQVANNFYVSLNHGISYDVFGIPTNYIVFNSAGEPGIFSNSACSSNNFSLYNASVIRLSFGSSSLHLSFYIYPNTGIVSSNGTL